MFTFSIEITFEDKDFRTAVIEAEPNQFHVFLSEESLINRFGTPIIFERCASGKITYDFCPPPANGQPPLQRLLAAGIYHHLIGAPNLSSPFNLH